MFKKVLVITLFVALMAVGVRLGSQASAVPTPKPEKVTICHRTNSVSNPYTSNTVAESSVDGPNTLPADHQSHLGPVFDPTVSYPTPHNGDQWGDIIPPFDEFGVDRPDTSLTLNWNTEGMAIFRNDCNIPVNPDISQIVFDVVCDTLDGKVVAKVTFTNFGGLAGDVVLNDEKITVTNGSPVVRYIDAGTNVKIEVNKEVVYDQVPDCDEPEGGRGGGPTTTPTTPAPTVQSVVLPATGAFEPAKVASVAAVGLSAVIGLAFSVTRIATKFVK